MICLLLGLLLSCGPQPKQKDETPETAEGISTGYAKYPMGDFKHLKINCDYGRLGVKVYQYEKPYVEVHETYRKYINFEERGDSLIIYATKTPKSTDAHPVKKRIRIYVPDLDSYSSEISTTTFMNFRTPKMNVELDNDYFRMYECGFEQLFIMTKAACKIVIDNENVVLAAKIQMNEESYLNCEAPIGDLVLTKKSLNNVRITKISAANFNWVKK
jgi:hypothetical protein